GFAIAGRGWDSQEIREARAMRRGRSINIAQLATFHRNVLVGIDRPLILRAGTNEPVVAQLLHDVRGPAGNPRNGKHRSEQVDIYTQGVIGRSRVEINVGIEFALSDDEFLDFARNLEPLGIAARITEIT